MARTFENPINRHQETISSSDGLAVFFLGLLYLIFEGLWNHVFIWLLIVIGPAFVFGPIVIIITLPSVAIAYALGIQEILAGRYLRNGWREVIAGGASPSSSSADGMKLCPYCAEEVKAAASMCKHCQSDLPPSAGLVGEST